ncbi:uncharacterized protein SCHCODRAFT_02620780 [Schizophyllum commune H4-8]|uniref:uncharacterized protein n=1 Tax=Schizophyllum commune (strain H4-8 / FGSC 9210) TaxID=578458 RepID=UPI00216050DC|nr:uncharacterized protein SCHCODRAFT_02620780 [Schizophyllum commune H4-8]KAI5893076.1 hypothetical protein SCHCODRAFT_02620780 [Schizophyllum commune H4-8]
MDFLPNDDLAQAAASIDAVCDFLDHASIDELPSPPYAELLQPIHAHNTLSICESSKREHTGRLAISLATSAHVAKKLPKGWEGAIEYAISVYVHPRVLESMADTFNIRAAGPTPSHLAFLRYASDAIGCYGDKGRRGIEAWLLEIYALLPAIHIPGAFYASESGSSYNYDFARDTLALRLGDPPTPLSISSSPSLNLSGLSWNSEDVDDEFSQYSISDLNSASAHPTCALLDLTVEARRQISACGDQFFAQRPLGPLERGHLLSQRRSTLVLEHQGALVLNNHLWPVLLYRWPDASLDFCATMLDLLTSDVFLAHLLLQCSQEVLALEDVEALARAVRAYLGQYWRMRGWHATRDLCLQVWVPLIDIAFDMVGLSATSENALASALSTSASSLNCGDVDETLVETSVPRCGLPSSMKKNRSLRRSLAPYVVERHGRRMFVPDDGWRSGKENICLSQLPASKAFFDGVHTTRRTLLEKSPAFC